MALTVSQLAGRRGGLNCDDHIRWCTVVSTDGVSVIILHNVLQDGP